jgi:hypothetical protein
MDIFKINPKYIKKTGAAPLKKKYFTKKPEKNGYLH